MKPLTDEQLAAHVDTQAALLGLPIDPAWRASVIVNFGRLAAVAATLDRAPVEPAHEPAPRFEP
jgi:Protein of unknown function (DUF4089)